MQTKPEIFLFYWISIFMILKSCKKSLNSFKIRAFRCIVEVFEVKTISLSVTKRKLKNKVNELKIVFLDVLLFARHLNNDFLFLLKLLKAQIPFIRIKSRLEKLLYNVELEFLPCQENCPGNQDVFPFPFSRFFGFIFPGKQEIF